MVTKTAQGRRRAEDTGPPRTDGDELTVLLAFLDYLRGAIVDKLAGAPEPQVRTAGVASGTTVLGLVKHLTAVERFYLLGEDVRDWAATMRPTATDTVETVITAYPDLTRPAPRTSRKGRPPSMRWLLIHLIEETGRHAGHADILREQIDGATGR
jgi:hypothetical protein